MVAEGSEIEVYVSIGPEFTEIKMPDVRGMDVNAATAQLEELGFTVRINRPCEGGMTVVETDPIPGTPWPQNQPVALFLC